MIISVTISISSIRVKRDLNEYTEVDIRGSQRLRATFSGCAYRQSVQQYQFSEGD